MKRRRKLKDSLRLEITTSSKEYKSIRNSKHWLEYDCGLCPMYVVCSKHKYKDCQPNRTFDRSWKNYRKTQWKY